MKRFTLPPDFARSDDLKRIVEYSVAQQDQSQTKTVLLHVGVSIVAAIAPVTYLKPSYQDTPPYGLPDLSSIRVGQVISTWVATTSLLYLACTGYMETRMQYLAPPELTDICDGMSREQISKQDWGIGIVSLASAVPLTTPLVKFPLISTGNRQIDVPANIGLVSVILISNSIAHLRPLQVIINDPWYGAPYAAIQYLNNKRKQRRMTGEAKSQQQLESLKRVKQNRLKNLFSQTLLTNGEQLIQECIHFQWCPLPGYRFQLTEYFRHVNSLTDDAFIFSLIDVQRKEFSQMTAEGTWKQSIYNFSRNVFAQIAGILALGESIGYLGDSGFELAKLVHNTPGGWILAATPIYAFGVLIHNAARAQTLDVVDFFFALIQGKATLSWPLKYGARSFFGLSIPSLLILLLNSSSANTMIRSDFGEYCSDTFIEKYIATFRWGYVWLATLLVINTEKYLFSKTAKYLGSEDSKAIAAFSERLQDTVNIRLSQWKPERFLAWIAVQTPEFREQALNIPETVYQDLTASSGESKSSKPSRRCISLGEMVCMIFSCFNPFKKESSEEESLMTSYQPLSEVDEEKSVNTRQLQSAPPQSSWWSTCCFWQRKVPENTQPSSNMSYEV